MSREVTQHDADATIMAATGPNSTAAKSIGNAEIDSSMVELRRTLLRSANAAAAASPSTTRGGPKSCPAYAKKATSPSAVTARAAA